MTRKERHSAEKNANFFGKCLQSSPKCVIILKRKCKGRKDRRDPVFLSVFMEKGEGNALGANPGEGMKLKKNGPTEQVVRELAAPFAEAAGVTIWDVCFEKEGAAWYLRVFIDKEDGIDIDDCEAVSRPLSDALDEADPISQAYFLEVGSAGLERELSREAHFDASIGTQIRVRLIRPENGEKEYIGELKAYEKENLTLMRQDAQGETVVSFANIAHVKRYEEFE